eukprot:1142189-Pelagomonas_calceolata.AAC.2
MREFVVDLRKRLRGAWNADALAEHVPSDHNVRASTRLPRHMHLVLSQHVMRNVCRFRLKEHTLKVETAAGDTRNALLCDR